MGVCVCVCLCVCVCVCVCQTFKINIWVGYSADKTLKFAHRIKADHTNQQGGFRENIKLIRWINYLISWEESTFKKRKCVCVCHTFKIIIWVGYSAYKTLKSVHRIKADQTNHQGGFQENIKLIRGINYLISREG